MKKTIIHSRTGDLADYQVVDMDYNDRPARVLLAGRSETPQSGVAMDDDGEPLFAYNQRFLEIAQSVQPTSVLIIGGGAFTLPTTLHERFGELTIDAVELDEQLPSLAKEYFGLPSSDRLNVVVADGRAFIEQTSSIYDLVVVDAFVEHDIPISLLSIEAARQYRRILAPDGVLAINFISRYHTHRTTLSHQLVATFGAVFEGIELYPADPHYGKREDQNLILTVSLRQSPALDYLQSAPVTLLFEPDLATVLLHDEV